MENKQQEISGIHDPVNPSKSEQASGAEAHTEETGMGVPAITPKSRLKRVWLLWCLLVLLLVLIMARDELRKNVADSSQQAVRYLAFDILDMSPRDVFVWRMRLAGLEDSPLGQRWKQAVMLAGDDPVQTGERFQTVKTFESDQVEAHIYQVTLERGEKLMWQFSRLDNADNQLYASLERREKNQSKWSTVSELDANGANRSQLISVAGDYRFVFQPELFANARYSIAIANGGSLPFPVEGAAQRDIGSRFGAARDGGARKHHGVDIFAKRGTPVTAVVDGHVRTGTSNLGGKHVWLSSGLVGFWGTRYYYAHLDDFAVESGDKVKKGDVLGYVGNTGNAKTTPPHLHFGIYANGAVDPDPFLQIAPVLPVQLVD